MSELTSIHGHRNSPFEEIKFTTDDKREYWSARDLMAILEYSSYRNFMAVVEKAMKSCENSEQNVAEHFAITRNMVDIGKGAKRMIEDYFLTRYACYLIIQNADPIKPMVALGQTYFAIQTRKQEVFEQKTEEEKRLLLRNELKKHNKFLASAAKNAGVITGLDFAIFQNYGYKGLYGGLTSQEIKEHRKLKKSQDILNHMGSTELAANLFRATQTEDKLKRENVQKKDHANQIHYNVGQKVRQTIKDLGGTMPERLPVEEDINKVERRLNKISKACKPKELE